MKAIRFQGYEREYPLTYGMLDFEGKTVVDIGADIGSSAYYFLSRGARIVICFESEPKLFETLLENAREDPRVYCHGEWIGQWVACDILKVDCEGCESLLTEDYLKSVPEFAVALHPKMISRKEDYSRLKDLILSLGAKLVFRTPDGAEEMYVRQQQEMGRRT
jgi:hypothetical protein